MPQEQRDVEVRFLDGSKRRGIATGNNAAWLCPCGRDVPLVGRTGLASGVTDAFRVDCPDCYRAYFPVPETHDRDRVDHVEEVATG
jgi:hypothetical protein